MSIRSLMNTNPALTIVVVAAVVGATVWIGVGSALPPTIKNETYFTADDGKTWFADKVTTVTPYTKDGKEVVRAYVYKCNDGKPFVAYLTRQNPSAATDTSGNALKGGSSPHQAIGVMNMEFKRPGDASWEVFGKMNATSKARIKPGCADGSTPQTVSP